MNKQKASSRKPNKRVHGKGGYPKIKAIVVDQSAPLKLAFGELPEPKPEQNQAIVKVAAVSLNRGEIAHVSSSLPDGASTGWDFAGTVEQPAGDGSGPKAGARVVGASDQKSFAEQVAATASGMAELPDSVSFEDAATLPIAGLTAYFSLWHGGLLLGKKVLVTGATGGVGHFAVQLANLSGAHVVASVRRPDGSKSPARPAHTMLPSAKTLPEPTHLAGMIWSWTESAGRASRTP